MCTRESQQFVLEKKNFLNKFHAYKHEFLKQVVATFLFNECVITIALKQLQKSMNDLE